MKVEKISSRCISIMVPLNSMTLNDLER